MKKLLLSVFAFSALTFSANAQAVAKVLSPASIEGNKTFTWADDWGQVPNFLLPGVFVQDTLAIAEDGTPGNSTTTIIHTLSQEGCSPFTNAAAIAGKIAVVYRGTCNFSTKAFNAQNAGAVGCIILNRDPEAVGMAAGVDGANVTIPVVMLTSTDGQLITGAISAGPVEMFLGNKVGLNVNDVTMTTETMKIPMYGSNSSLLSDNKFVPGLRIYNPGSATQSNVKANCTITDATATTLYNQTVNVVSLPGNFDSVTVYTGSSLNFPTFDINGLATGSYTVTYTVSLDAGLTEEDPSDNSFSTVFNVNPNVISLANLDATGKPVSSTYPSNATTPGPYQTCLSFENPSATDVAMVGLHFTPNLADTAGDMTAEEIAIFVYQWTDPNDLNTLNPLSNASYFISSNAESQVPQYQALPQPFLFANDVTYLICASTNDNSLISFGYDTDYEYEGNRLFDTLFPSPIQNGGTWFRGWNGTSGTSLGIQVIDPATISVLENNPLVASVYPNPTSDNLSIRVNAKGNAAIVVSDLTGKIVYSSNVAFDNGSAELNMSKFEAGMYILNVTLESGESTKTNIVKK